MGTDGGLLTLRDGRRLAYAEFGAPTGRPILYCHGFPASRLDGHLANDAATRLNLRFIAPDRPGFGLSDFQRGRRISDWARDVLELADTLSLRQFPVLGISGGAPYAVACAAGLGSRVQALGLVCGLGRVDRSGDSAGMNPFARLSFAAARSVPPLSRLINRALAPVLRSDTRLMFRVLASQLPPPDREVLSDPVTFQRFEHSYREALRQGGRGAALELTLYARPWDFAPGTIDVPAFAWHGGQDTTVPVAMGERLAAEIPGCRMRLLPDEGHFSLPVRRMDEILSALA